MGAFNIPLQVRQPDMMLPAEAEAKQLGLRQLAGAVDAQKQQARMREMEMQEEALQIKAAEKLAEDTALQRTSQNAWRSIYKENQGDIEKAIAAAAKNPAILPEHLDNVKKARLAQQQAEIQYQADVARLDTDKFNLQAKRDEEIGRSIRAIRDVPVEQRANVFESEVKRLLDLKAMTPEQAKRATELDLSDDAALLGYEQHYRGLDAVNKSEKTRRDAAEAAARQADEDIRKARQDAAASFAQVDLSDPESLTEWRNSLPEKVGGKDFRRNYPMSFEALGGSKGYAERVARMGRTQKEQDEYEKSLKPTKEPNPTQVSLALDAAGGDPKAKKALEILAKQAAAERVPKDDDSEEKLEKKIEGFQKTVDSLQEKKDRISAENKTAGNRMVEIQEEIDELLAAKSSGQPLKGNEKTSNQSRIQKLRDQKRELQTQIDQNKGLFDSYHEQQKSTNAQKDRLSSGASGDEETVEVILPDGRRVVGPKKNLAAAKARGAKEVNAPAESLYDIKMRNRR